MRYPQLVILAFDDWLGKQLTEFTSEHRWLIKEVRQVGACRTLLRESRPTVLLVQIDPHSDGIADLLQFLIDIHRFHPSVATVAISDVKLNEDERSTWAATAFDLGVRFVLFPPLTRPVLEDLVGGLMASLLERVGRDVPALPQRQPESVIDLAEEGAVE